MANKSAQRPRFGASSGRTCAQQSVPGLGMIGFVRMIDALEMTLAFSRPLVGHTSVGSPTINYVSSTTRRVKHGSESAGIEQAAGAGPHRRLSFYAIPVDSSWLPLSLPCFSIGTGTRFLHLHELGAHDGQRLPGQRVPASWSHPARPHVPHNAHAPGAGGKHPPSHSSCLCSIREARQGRLPRVGAR